jgi:hypothetical protein
MLVKKFSATIIILGLVFFMMLAGANNVKAEEANSMWLEPSAINFGYANETSYNATVGTEFNVTAWAYIASSASFGWQVTILFNPYQVQAVAAGYTAGTTSQFFAGHSTATVTPFIDNAAGKVMFGEALYGSDSVAANTTNSLMWAEFRVVSIPNAITPSLKSTLSLGTPDSTYFFNPSVTTIPTTNVGATYSFTYGGPPAPLTIDAVTQAPTTVYGGQSVTVSSNVTGGVGGVDTVTLSYSTDNATFTDVTMTLNGATGLYEGIIPEQLNGTTVYYLVTAYDAQGNEALSNNAGANWSYSVTAPPLTIGPVTQTPAIVYVGDNVTVSANVTSEFGVTNVTLSYSTDNATFTDVTMTLNGATGLYEGTIPEQSNGWSGTTVYYLVTAYDLHGNSAGVSRSYSISAWLPLVIGTPTYVALYNSVNDSESVTVLSQLTSGFGVTNVTLSYSTDNVTFNLTVMAFDPATGLYGGTIPEESVGTIVYYFLTAYDTQGNEALSNNAGANWSYSIERTVPEFGSPILLMVTLLAVSSAVLLMRKKAKLK